MFSLLYKVKLAAFKSKEKCATFKIGQYKFVYPFLFSATRTSKQALITYHLYYCSKLASCYQSCMTLFQCMKTHQLWASCVKCLFLNEPRLYPSSDSHFILFTSCTTQFLFYNFLFHCSYSFYFTNDHNPFGFFFCQSTVAVCHNYSV